ncbi:peroxisomal membrane protein 2 [Venturia canescens]|uniref:peroxisomal membrane protein 2 n=1 Tax=Venturia canescens TaxID=32260 RepID=UPI001C9BED4D|nr:peroxisomal membrane protein 2 [Venturia canescens]
MSLSKPKEILYDLLGRYFRNLYTHPIKTKAITSCVTAVLGNYLAQKLTRAQHINQDSLMAFALFGLLCGGPISHFFYQWVPLISKNPLTILLIERTIYTPCYQAFALYMLARFEGKSHENSMKNLHELYWPILEANLKYLTLLQFINIRYVPPVLRVLMVSIIGLMWTIFLAKKRERLAASKRMKP